jgi:hypothetical protein
MSSPGCHRFLRIHCLDSVTASDMRLHPWLSSASQRVLPLAGFAIQLNSGGFV